MHHTLALSTLQSKTVSSALVSPCPRTSVVNHVTTHFRPSTSVAPHSTKVGEEKTCPGCPWIWVRVCIRRGKRASSATLPTSHGYKRRHTAFNKIVMPMGIMASKSRPNASVPKQLQMLYTPLSRTVCLLQRRQSNSSKTICGSMSPVW